MKALSPLPLASRPNQAAFSLVELIVSMAVLSILMVVVVQLTSQMRQALDLTKSKVEMFREARSAFQTITQRLSQATLNTYWDYDDPTSPTQYVRNSNLHFISGPTPNLLGSGSYSGHAVFFNAPLGYTEENANYGDLTHLLSDVGYFVEYTAESDWPSFLGSAPASRQRWRLRQYLGPAEASLVQENNWNAGNRSDWFSQEVSAHPERIYNMADNIIALYLLPMLPASEDDGSAIATDYNYDSRQERSFTTSPPANSNESSYSGNTLHQLPPLMRVIMVAVDENSFSRLEQNALLNPMNLIPSGLFQSADKLEEDLVDLEQALVNLNGLNYRIFDTTVTLRGAKWSRD